jgi:dUTP pyrophosphatase
MIGIYKYDERAKTPTRNLRTDAGLDVYAIENQFIELGTTVKIDLGLAIEVHVGYVGKLEDRSSLAALGLKVSGGVIDATYTGRLSVVLSNLTCKKETKEVYRNGYYQTVNGYNIKAGDRIAQLLLYKVETPPVVQVTELWETVRSDKGFGSSGK